MNQSRRTIAVVGALAIVAGGAFLALRPREPESVVVSDGTVYYNGPMRAKGGTTYGTADGQSFTAEQAANAEKTLKSGQSPTPP